MTSETLFAAAPGTDQERARALVEMMLAPPDEHELTAWARLFPRLTGGELVEPALDLVREREDAFEAALAEAEAAREAADERLDGARASLAAAEQAGDRGAVEAALELVGAAERAREAARRIALAQVDRAAASLEAARTDAREQVERASEADAEMFNRGLAIVRTARAALEERLALFRKGALDELRLAGGARVTDRPFVGEGARAAAAELLQSDQPWAPARRVAAQVEAARSAWGSS